MFRESLFPESLLLSSKFPFEAQHPMFRYQVESAPADFVKRLHDAQEVVVVGMGGSVLPLKVFVEAGRLNEKIFLWDSVEIEAWQAQQKKLRAPLFCLVSKSGTTLEVAALASWILQNYSKESLAVVSDPGSPLEKWAQDSNLPFCPIPPEIGGRFTHFTPFHRSVLEWAGISFEPLIIRARTLRDHLKENPQELEALFHQIFGYERKGLILWAYGERAHGLALWMQQAIAESLGKRSEDGKRHGILPSVLRGPQDQHSVLQLLRDGPQDKTLWFLECWQNSTEELQSTERPFRSLRGKALSKILEILAESTFESFKERIDQPETFQPLLRWTLDDPLFGAVEAIVRVQALMEYAGKRLEINPFDQPGVERGKQIARELLDA